MENNDENNTGKVSFNQALFYQTRLDILFQRINNLSSLPLQINEYYHVPNYKIIANDLITAYLTISSKLTNAEKEMMNEKRDKIKIAIKTNPPHKIAYNYLNKPCKGFSEEAWDIISDLFLDFRLELEMLMERTGFGNPNKDDPSKSAVDM